MFTIIKKELKTYFRKGSAYFFIAASLFVSGILAAAYNLYLGSSQIEIILPTCAIVFALTLPLLVMNIFAGDRKSGSDKLLFALPFRSSDIVLGKYLAMLLIVAVETVELAILPLIFGAFGEVNYLSAYLSLLCFFLFCAAALAICIFIAAITKKKALTIVFSYTAFVLSFLLYLVPTGISDGLFKTSTKAIRFVSLFSHLDGLFDGAFNVGSVIYFIIVSIVFLALATLAVSKARATVYYGSKSVESKHFTLTPVFAVILSACMMISGAALSLLPMRYSTVDMSTSEAFTLRDGTKEFLASLDCEIDIYVINPDGTNTQFEALVALYEEYSPKLDVINVTEYDIEEMLLSLGWDGISPIAPYTLIVESSKDRVQIYTPDSAYYYYHPMFGQMSEDQYYQYYQLLYQYASSDPENYGEALNTFINETKYYSNDEQMLTSCIEYTALDIIPDAYYVTGHGEPAVDASNLYYFFYSVGFDFRTLDLGSIDELPEDASCLILNTPASDLSEKELKLVSDFLSNGGSMTLITNEANLDMPNLMSILSHYGVFATKGAVSFDYEAAAKAEAESEAESNSSEETSDEEVEENEEAEEITYPDNKLVVVGINSAHASLANLAGYSTQVFGASSIESTADIRESVTVTPLLYTSEDCFIDGVENSVGTKIVAVAIEESVNDATTQIAWYTGGDSFDGDNIETMNAYCSIYSIIWGVDEPVSELGEIAPREINYQYIEVSPEARLAIIAIIIAVIPSAFIVAGSLARAKLKKKPSTKKSEDDSAEETPEEPENTNNTEE